MEQKDDYYLRAEVPPNQTQILASSDHVWRRIVTTTIIISEDIEVYKCLPIRDVEINARIVIRPRHVL